ncbi:hypothetical protein CKA32_000968 [Geitlerinema sp. FC II]|nr:hypothetical protein CKA32_000968 [Geitlerinema sp. FC II]
MRSPISSFSTRYDRAIGYVFRVSSLTCTFCVFCQVYSQILHTNSLSS